MSYVWKGMRAAALAAGLMAATAAQAATEAAEATSSLTPKLGRARPLAEKSIGHPDAGAVSLALTARVVGAFLAQTAKV